MSDEIDAILALSDIPTNAIVIKLVVIVINNVMSYLSYHTSILAQ
jgi:hypothetical protein